MIDFEVKSKKQHILVNIRDSPQDEYRMQAMKLMA